MGTMIEYRAFGTHDACVVVPSDNALLNDFCLLSGFKLKRIIFMGSKIDQFKQHIVEVSKQGASSI